MMADRLRRILIALVSACVVSSFGFAEGYHAQTSVEVEGDYQFPFHEGVDASGLVPIAYGVVGGTAAQPREAGTSWGGGQLKGIIDRSLVFPFLAGTGALTRGNNLGLDFSGELSPVSINANFKATLTPVAFFKLDAGAGLGTGWDIGFVGMGVNDKGVIDPQNFGGLIYRGWVEGTFQFDLAALLPGEWNHVVILASDKAEYQAYTGADANTPWIWEADEGMDFNGWQLYGNYFLGYQMPIVLDTVGFLLQSQGWLGSVRDRSTEASGGWGSDFTYLTFGPLFDFKLGRKSSLAVLPQFKTGIKWSDATEWSLDFQTRAYEGQYLYFYQMAFDYNLEL
jgi:hypothetical protein